VPPPADAHWQITQLDLSRCNLGQRGLAALGEALAAFEHGLQLLDLSYCDLPEKPLAAFFEALQRNFAVSLTLEAYSPPPPSARLPLAISSRACACRARALFALFRCDRACSDAQPAGCGSRETAWHRRAPWR
jgi:hypothetical protein